MARRTPNTAEIKRKAERFHRAREATGTARVDLEDAILAAKRDDVSFRQIADSIGLSVAWAQKAIANATERESAGRELTSPK